MGGFLKFYCVGFLLFFFFPQVKKELCPPPPELSFRIHLFLKNISSCFFFWETHTICKQVPDSDNSVILPGHSYFPAFNNARVEEQSVMVFLLFTLNLIIFLIKSGVRRAPSNRRWEKYFDYFSVAYNQGVTLLIQANLPH